MRRQVCRRIDGRVKALGLSGIGAYRHYLERHPEEWAVFDRCCFISISRFARDHEVSDRLSTIVFPDLTAAATRRGSTTLHAWSAGCASGEEPYTLALYWHLRVKPLFPGFTLRVIATDLDRGLLARAATARYAASSLSELPAPLRAAGFHEDAERFLLREQFRQNVEFLLQDLREETPPGPFDLVLCRNVAFTYFAIALQHTTLRRLLETMQPGGALVIGSKERLPDHSGTEPWLPALGVYRRK